MVLAPHPSEARDAGRHHPTVMRCFRTRVDSGVRGRGDRSAGVRGKHGELDMTDKQPDQIKDPETGTVQGFVIAQEQDGIASVVGAAADDQGNAIVEGVVADQYGVLAEGAIGVSGSDAIIVAAFANEEAATAAYHGLIDAEAAGNLGIEGVLVAKADAEGKIHVVKMTDHKTRNGFLAGAVAGVVLGIIFPPSILASALTVGVGGAAVGKIGNVATKSAVAKDLASVLTPGSSGIIALVKLTQVEEVKQQLPEATAVKSAPVSEEAAAT